MSEFEQEYASRIVLGVTEEKLQEAKVRLEQELAATALRLVEVQRQLELEPAPITARVQTAYHEWQDSGYVGGYAMYDQKSFIITASHFQTIFLGALAKQSTAIGNGTSLYRGDIEERDMFTDHSSITLEQVQIGGEGDTIDVRHPLDKIAATFRTAREGAFLIVKGLRESIEDNNPYKEIPIRINQSELRDALLRVEILRYCNAHDPHFAIQEITKS